MRDLRLTDNFAYANVSVMSLVSVGDAATRLGITARQVQHLVARGELTAPARGVIDSDSLERFLAVMGRDRTRAWAEPTAWGAAALLSGREASWMGATQRSRLRARLRSLTAVELVERTRERAAVTRYSGHSATTAPLRAAIVDTSPWATRLGLTPATGVDGYVASKGLDGLVRQFALAPDDGGRIVLRATTFPIQTVRELADAGVVLAALDLAASLDMRERRAGLDALTDALETLRG